MLRVLSRIPQLACTYFGIERFRFTPVSIKPEQLLLNSQVFLHACKTPVTVLKCGLELLREQVVSASPESTEVFSSLESCVCELEQLLHAVHAEVVSTQSTFSLRSALANVTGLLRLRFRHAHIFVEVPKDVQLTGNRLYFEEALRCVVSNGLEAYKRSSSSCVHILARNRAEALQIDIIDSGFGMGAATKLLALVSGISYKDSGSGIGLQFARLTVEKMFGGKMIITSQLGVGTRVTWILPHSVSVDTQHLGE